MVNKTLRGRCLRFVTAIALGGSAFQLSGCDPNVRATLLGGLAQNTNSLADAMISAFFISLQDGDSSSTSLTTTTP